MYIAQLLKEHGCTKIVISPGSRNAPLIIALTADSDYKCYSVPDERSAGFVALGMTIEMHEPVAVICTSGSAAANYYPAVVEAFYQKRPLIVITADRPAELIDQGVGQTIRQDGLYKNHIIEEVNLIGEPDSELSGEYNQRMINQALIASVNGPVHINIPFDEPLYDKGKSKEKAKVIRKPLSVAARADLSGFKSIWDASEKVMILAGYMDPFDLLFDNMDSLNEVSPYLILSETVSNLPAYHNIKSIDRIINTISEREKEKLRPDLLITMGGELVSKMVKKFIKDFPPKQHWHLSPTGEVRDTFQLLDGVIHSDEAEFFGEMAESAGRKNPEYRTYWIDVDRRKRLKQKQFSQECPFSDWQVFDKVLRYVPEVSILHTANSASIRYSQLFDHRDGIDHYTNRGTSGIDGCTSTAVGHALSVSRMVTLITGDVAFLYDSNAFWINELPSNLRVIVVNNQGGNIFRIINGPDRNGYFEKYQETVHNLNLSSVAALYSIDFQTVASLERLMEVLPDFFKESGGPRILEVKTPRTTNPEVLKSYFEYLKD